jgi:type II secretory pathway predicted ATPase ExeA
MTRPPIPFPAGPDVSAYVPNAEVEQSLGYLAAKLTEAPGWVGVCGPPGVGKSLALRLLLRRLADRFTPVYVPTAALAPDELQRWILDQADAASREDAAALARRVAAAGRPLLLAIDEAQLASDALVASLEALCAGPAAARGVLAWTELEGERPHGPLARCATRVFLDPLDLAQVPSYVAAQLARASAEGAQRDALSGRTLERIALASGGNPRLIQRLADAELAAQAWRARKSAPAQAETAGAPPPPPARQATNAPRAAPLPAAAPSAKAPRRTLLRVLAAGAALAALVAAGLALAR